MPDDNIKYSIVIPVYDSAESLTALAGRIEKVFDEKINGRYEIIMVDDGSSNLKTWKTIEDLSAAYPPVKGIRLTRNFGKAGALLCGFEEAKGDYIITMDDDLQNLPEDIPLLLREGPRRSDRELQKQKAWACGAFNQ